MHTGGLEVTRFGGAICLALMFVFTDVANGQGKPTISVCDALENLAQHSEKAVAVHGELAIDRHGVAIFQENCRIAFKTAGMRWQSAIHLAFPSMQALKSSADPDTPSVRFMFGLVTLLQQYRIEKQLLIPPFRVSATFIGELHMAPQKPEGVLYGPGFGYLSSFPIELYLQAVRDVVITGLSTKDAPQR